MCAAQHFHSRFSVLFGTFPSPKPSYVFESEYILMHNIMYVKHYLVKCPQNRLKLEDTRYVQPKIAEENLTYAELELMKPIQEAKGIPSTTVYAQILFEENKL
ncbi:v-set and transmembrane hypothetical protein [Limosa lapponica baueri]|uniref:Uncharacterized protein n=1 Tax=Limosa lapponica baueri TaxID=1758121 RepID=A0A2I0TES1_LIMLA|nr:v-set and transmembrane hypothetical protein [Limosa lapponica baueri]